jgi:hypothetical protein
MYEDGARMCSSLQGSLSLSTILGGCVRMHRTTAVADSPREEARLVKEDAVDTLKHLVAL